MTLFGRAVGMLFNEVCASNEADAINKHVDEWVVYSLEQSHVMTPTT